jgi:adenylate cyclase
VAREQRRLAAIVAADVVGYSRLMGRDESGTVARLRQNRAERFDPILARYGGRLVKLTGDGALVEFGSAVDALSAVIEFQQAMAEANSDQSADTVLVFRMGLHLGDLIVDGEDLYGDGVNVAARLEGEAPAGGILISRNVRDAVAGRLKATFEDLGGLSLKNIERPVRAFRVHWEALDWRSHAAPEVPIAPAVTLQSAPASLALSDKPSIAVLPFQNMSGDPGQEYFVDGLVEDIIAGLSRFKSLFVIARNSSFAYKGKSPDIRQVGRELGVRYVLEGSVRRANSRLRISGQLIDASDGAHLWADRFEGAIEGVFELQDRVTTSVVGIIAPRVNQAEIDRVRGKPAGKFEAYDLILRGQALVRAQGRNEMDQALRLFRQAVELDRTYARALALLSGCCFAFISQGFGHRDDPQVSDLVQIAQKAVALDAVDPEVLALASHVLALPGGDMETGVALVEKAINFNPNSALAFRLAALFHGYLKPKRRLTTRSVLTGSTHWTLVGTEIWDT